MHEDAYIVHSVRGFANLPIFTNFLPMGLYSSQGILYIYWYSTSLTRLLSSRLLVCCKGFKSLFHFLTKNIKHIFVKINSFIPGLTEPCAVRLLLPGKARKRSCPPPIPGDCKSGAGAGERHGTLPQLLRGLRGRRCHNSGREMPGKLVASSGASSPWALLEGIPKAVPQ